VARKSQIDRQRSISERAHFSGLLRTYCINWLVLHSLGLVYLQQPSHCYSAVPTQILFSSENLGVSLVIVGIVVIALAAWRYKFSGKSSEETIDRID